MKAAIIYHNHEIVLARSAMKTALYIDGVEVDRQIGIIEHDKDHIYSGSIYMEDGKIDVVNVEFKCGFPGNIMNSVFFKVNGELVGESEVL